MHHIYGSNIILFQNKKELFIFYERENQGNFFYIKLLILHHNHKSLAKQVNFRLKKGHNPTRS